MTCAHCGVELTAAGTCENAECVLNIPLDPAVVLQMVTLDRNTEREKRIAAEAEVARLKGELAALVEVVRAVDKHFVGHFQGYNHCGHCSCQSWALRPIHHAKDCPMIPGQAALAAIEEAK